MNCNTWDDPQTSGSGFGSRSPRALDARCCVQLSPSRTRPRAVCRAPVFGLRRLGLGTGNQAKRRGFNSQTWRCNQQGGGLNHPKMWLDQHKNIGFHQHEWWFRAQTIPTESWTTPRTMAYFQSETSPFFAQRILKVPHLEAKNGNPKGTCAIGTGLITLKCRNPTLLGVTMG